MKRRLIAFFAALLMLTSIAIPAFAEEPQTDPAGTEPPEDTEQILDATTTTEMMEVLEDGTTVKVITSVTVIPAEEEAEAEPDHDIVILFTNDVHCGVQKGVGYSGLARLKQSLIQAGKNVLLVDSGDSVQGDTIGTLSKGEYIIELMNQVGYHIATIGNHEFDYGMEQFFSNIEKAEFPYVCCNFLNSEGKPVLDAYRIFEIAGKKVAFVGVATPDTFTSSTPTYFQDSDGKYIYSFCEDDTGRKLYDTVQLAVNGSIAEGADYVIVLSHLGINAEDSPWTSSELIEHTNGINAVLDGHSHSVIEKELVKNKDGKDVILTSTGTHLENVGCLMISEEGKMNSILLNNSTVEFGMLNGTLSDDGGISELIDKINEEFAELTGTVIAHTEYDLVTHDPVDPSIRIIRSQETNLGDLCADAFREVSGADIAFINGGGVRAAIPEGDITYGTVIAVHPFGNHLSVAEVTGQEILDALEFSAHSLPGEFGGFLHVSGLTYMIDLNVDSTVEMNDHGEFESVKGDRRVKNVRVLNRDTNEMEPIDPEKQYTLASFDYLLQDGGDGYTMFADNNYLQDRVMLDNQVLITYIEQRLNALIPEQYRDPYGEGRIEVIERGKATSDMQDQEENSSDDEDAEPQENAHSSAPGLNG